MICRCSNGSAQNLEESEGAERRMASRIAYSHPLPLVKGDVVACSAVALHSTVEVQTGSPYAPHCERTDALIDYVTPIKLTLVNVASDVGLLEYFDHQMI